MALTVGQAVQYRSLRGIPKAAIVVATHDSLSTQSEDSKQKIVLGKDADGAVLVFSITGGMYFRAVQEVETGVVEAALPRDLVPDHVPDDLV